MSFVENEWPTIQVFFSESLPWEGQVLVQGRTSDLLLRTDLSPADRRKISEQALQFADSHGGSQKTFGALFDSRYDEPIATFTVESSPDGVLRIDMKMLHPEAIIRGL